MISPRPAQFKLPPPPRATCNGEGDPPADRQTIRGFVEDHTKDPAPVSPPFVRDAVTDQQPQQPQPQQQPQQSQLRTRRFKVPPPIKCVSEPLDRGSRESYEMMTPLTTMSPNRQVMSLARFDQGQGRLSGERIDRR